MHCLRLSFSEYLFKLTPITSLQIKINCSKNIKQNTSLIRTPLSFPNLRLSPQSMPYSMVLKGRHTHILRFYKFRTGTIFSITNGCISLATFKYCIITLNFPLNAQFACVGKFHEWKKQRGLNSLVLCYGEVVLFFSMSDNTIFTHYHLYLRFTQMVRVRVREHNIENSNYDICTDHMLRQPTSHYHTR